MKILFINPSLRPGNKAHLFLPVGLAYVMTYAKENGYKFDLLDIDAGNYSNDYVEKYFMKNKYDVVCVGSIVTHYRWIKWCVNMIKEHQPEAKVVVGNSVGGSIPEVLFQTTKVDVVIYGEAEVTIKELFDAFKSNKSLGDIVEPHVEIPHMNKGYPATIKGVGIPGIIYRAKNNLIVNNGKRKAVKNIDDFPFPDWDLFDVKTYLKAAKSLNHTGNYTWNFPLKDSVVMPVNLARGCVFKCTFCHYVFWHDPYRHRSAQNVIAEIKQLRKKYNANFFNFWDELSFHKIGPANKFLDELIKEDMKIHFTCSIRSDLLGRDVDTKDKVIPREERLELARKFVKAGCTSAVFSLESGNDGILESMNKRVKSKYFEEQVNICRESNLKINTSIIIGYPQETSKTINETMSKLEQLKVYPSVGFLLPMPETGMWKYSVENNHITDIDKYLTEMTERQDFSINLTKMDHTKLIKETKDWLARLNKKFGNLDEKKLLKTGGYGDHTNMSKIDRNKTTEDTHNWATQSGTVR